MKKFRNLDMRKYSIKDGIVDWVGYSIIFAIILTPFIEYGVLKLLSVAIILGFFAHIINRIIREYIYFINANEKEPVDALGRSIERDSNLNYASDYKPTYTYRSIPDREYRNDNNAFCLDHKSFNDGQHY